MVKVLISDKLSPLAKEIFERRGIETDQIVGLTKEELEAKIHEYDGLAIRSATKVSPKILAAAKKLKVVGRAGIGVDNVDIPAATSHGVVVMNTPFGNSITTAEHAIAMMFAVARQIPEASASTHAGKWEKSRFMGVELTSKTLGIIGCGNIGAIAASRAIGLKMKVVAFDPFIKDVNLELAFFDGQTVNFDIKTISKENDTFSKVNKEIKTRLVYSWVSSVIGVAIIVAMIVLGSIDKVDWTTANVIIGMGIALLSKKDTKK